MAVTIHYRGTINSLSLAEDFEDRLLELALALGGTGRVWRSSPGGAPQRMFRGMILNLAPGQESTSLILSPEGWLVGLNDLEGAARPGLTIPPWCQVKTGLGPMEGHVALIEMFRVLKGEFLNDLEVRDETGYWESGDGLQLARSWGDATGHGGEGQPGFRGLSREAAEDPEIVGARLSRVAAVVRQTLGRPAQMLDPGGNSRAGQNSSRDLDDRSREQRWEQIERFRRRMQERLQRSIQERLSQGETIDQAIRGALESAGLPRPEELKLILPQELTDEDDQPTASPALRNMTTHSWISQATSMTKTRPTTTEHSKISMISLNSNRSLTNRLWEVSRDASSSRAWEGFPGNVRCRRLSIGRPICRLMVRSL